LVSVIIKIAQFDFLSVSRATIAQLWLVHLKTPANKVLPASYKL